MRSSTKHRGAWGAPPERDHPAKVLIISASMGAGHDGAARELATRLRHAGHQAEVRDFLNAAPLRIGSLLRRGYEFELRHVPSAYDATYRLWYRVPWLCPVISWFVCLLTRRRVRRWIRRDDIEIVVSTYPLATLCLGRLRTLGRLRIPAVNFITDFGVHPLWVHRGMDLNLAVHSGPADVARQRTGRPSIACGPVVGEAYGPLAAGSPASRAEARRELGLGPDDRAVLIVAGSWGIGGVEATFRAVAGTGRYVPVVICGRDETSRARIERLAATMPGRAVVVGWTDRMPMFMAGCDALLENAGGLTSLEALRIGLPVVSYQPIAGHGRENTSAMAAAGVSRLAGDVGELLVALDAVTSPGPSRGAQVLAGQEMFVADGARLVLDSAAPHVLATLARPSRGRVVWASTSRSAAVVVAAAALVWGGLTTGVDAAAANGLGAAHPVAGGAPAAYIGVRLSASELFDPAVTHEIRALGVSAVIDRVTAFEAPGAVRALAASGVDVDNGGRGLWLNHLGRRASPELWTRAHGDVEAGAALSALIGRPVLCFVPGRRINAFDMLDAHHANEKLVVANDEIDAGTTPLPGVHAREIVLLNGLFTTPAQLLETLHQLGHEAMAAHLAVRPLSSLT